MVDALTRQGFVAQPEAARAIIRVQRTIGGTALPWVDWKLFGELLLSWHLRSYDEGAQTGAPVFFDRGLPDMIAYYSMRRFPAPRHVVRATESCRYHRRVFLAEPWDAVYRQDTERTETYAEAVTTHQHIADAYERSGYELVTIPQAPVEERVAFLLEAVEVLPP